MLIIRAPSNHAQVEDIFPTAEYKNSEPLNETVYSKYDILRKAQGLADKYSDVIVVESGVFIHEYKLYDICVVIKKDSDIVHEEIVIEPFKKKHNVVKEALQKIANFYD